MVQNRKIYIYPPRSVHPLNTFQSQNRRKTTIPPTTSNPKTAKKPPFLLHFPTPKRQKSSIPPNNFLYLNTQKSPFLQMPNNHLIPHKNPQPSKSPTTKTPTPPKKMFRNFSYIPTFQPASI